MAECSVEKCTREATRKGLCNMHYFRKRRTGEAGPAAPIIGNAQQTPCTHEGCNEPARAKSLCAKHYARRYRAQQKSRAPKGENALIADLEKLLTKERNTNQNLILRHNRMRIRIDQIRARLTAGEDIQLIFALNDILDEDTQ